MTGAGGLTTRKSINNIVSDGSKPPYPADLSFNTSGVLAIRDFH